LPAPTITITLHRPTLSTVLVPTMRNPSSRNAPPKTPEITVSWVGGEQWDPPGTSSPIGRAGTLTEKSPESSPQLRKADDRGESPMPVRTYTAVLLNYHCTSPDVRRGYRPSRFVLFQPDIRLYIIHPQSLRRCTEIPILCPKTVHRCVSHFLLGRRCPSSPDGS